jgi:hypothetical protein
MAEDALDAQVHLAARLGLGCVGNACVFLPKVGKKEGKMWVWVRVEDVQPLA